jgi:hypothetical protein
VTDSTNSGDRDRQERSIKKDVMSDNLDRIAEVIDVASSR